MPLYDFKCQACGSVFEEITKVGKDIAICPTCYAPAQRDAKPMPTANMNSAWQRQCRGK
jgi:putative FmdB family regulatory protein